MAALLLFARSRRRKQKVEFAMPPEPVEKELPPPPPVQSHEGEGLIRTNTPREASLPQEFNPYPGPATDRMF